MIIVVAVVAAVVGFGGSACARGKRSNENVKDKTYVQRREKIESAKVTGFISRKAREKVVSLSA